MKIFIQNLDEGIQQLEEDIPAGAVNVPDNHFYPDPIHLNIYIDRFGKIFRFKINIQTHAHYNCDRCLQSFEKEFDETIEQIYQLGHSEFDVDEEIVILPDNSKEIDISKAIYDAFLVNRPMQSLCDDNCKGLCMKCGTNLNQGTCNCSIEEIDPRLEKLKELLK